MAQDLSAEVLAHTAVNSIDAQAQCVTVQGADGATRTIHYRDLVLALGADPIRLPLQGNAARAGVVGQRRGRLCAL